MADQEIQDWLDLQSKAVDAGHRYVQEMWTGLDDVEKKAWLQNACAAGFIAGYRAAKREDKGE